MARSVHKIERFAHWWPILKPCFTMWLFICWAHLGAHNIPLPSRTRGTPDALPLTHRGSPLSLSLSKFRLEVSFGSS